jgi:hypothetical protein
MDDDYLRQIELLAGDVVDHARDAPPGTPLRQAVDELARRLRHEHFDGDGCVADATVPIAGASLVGPDTPNYHQLCELLGVPARDEGWALWFTWDDDQRAHTMVSTLRDTTRALLDRWAAGHDHNLPGRPDRAQIAAVCRRWIGPMTRAPSNAAHHGLGGR